MTFTDEIGARFYCIRSSNGEFWSNKHGWIEVDDTNVLSGYDVFTEEEKQNYYLPVDSGAFWEIL